MIHLAAQAGVRYSIDHPHAYGKCQSRRLPERARRMSASRRRASHLRLEQLRLRRQHQDAIFGARRSRSSRQSLRGHQEGERADGAYLLASLPDCRRLASDSSRSTDPGAALTCPPSCSSSESSKATHRRLQSRRPPTRLHVYRRHRRRRGSNERPAQRSRPGLRRTLRRIPHVAPRPGGSSTSAARARSSCSVTSRSSKSAPESEAIKNMLPMQPGDVKATERGRVRARRGGRLSTVGLTRRRDGRIRRVVSGVLRDLALPSRRRTPQGRPSLISARLGSRRIASSDHSNQLHLPRRIRIRSPALSPGGPASRRTPGWPRDYGHRRSPPPRFLRPTPNHETS